MDTESILLIGALAIVTLIALIAILRLLRVQRNTPSNGNATSNKNKTGQKNQKNPSYRDVDGQYRAMRMRKRGRGYLLWFLLTLPLAIAIIAGALWDWQQIDFGATWPVTEGNIINVEALPNYRSDGSIIREEHTVIALYQYRVDGLLHSGTIQEQANSAAQMQNLVTRYNQNPVLPIWYHPVLHEFHFLQPFGRIYNLVILGVGAFFALISMYMLYNALGAFAEAGAAARGS